MITTTPDYFLFAHRETKKSVPLGIKEYWIRFLNSVRSIFLLNGTTETIYKISFLERILDRLVLKIQNDFTTVDLELQAIHAKLMNEEITIENPKEDLEIIQKVITLLTKSNELFITISYFDNETLKAAVESSLHTSYLIEGELRVLSIKKRKEKREKDLLFSELASQPKELLLRAI